MMAFIYHRIDSRTPSSMDQKLMEGHLHKLQMEADKRGYTVEGVFSDFANGRSIERPGLRSLLDAVEGGSAKAILVSSLTRIARDRLTLMQIQKRLNSAGCTLLAVGDAANITDCTGRCYSS